jgi:hypothetical protein
MKKPAIPQVPPLNQPRAIFDRSVKETLEIITGRRDGKVQPLPSDASQADMLAKINELINRLQA